MYINLVYLLVSFFLSTSQFNLSLITISPLASTFPLFIKILPPPTRYYIAVYYPTTIYTSLVLTVNKKVSSYN